MAVKAVEMVREIRDRHYQNTKGLPVEEQIEFFKKKSEELKEKLKSLQPSTRDNPLHPVNA